MSRYILGKTECPPHGDINKPSARGIVVQQSGNRRVVAGSINDPGASCLMNPSSITSKTTTMISLIRYFRTLSLPREQDSIPKELE